jgi:hypothetical protein
MKSTKLTEYVHRDLLLKTLSDEEVASVSTAETAAQLPEDDEYVDLEHLDQGVQRAGNAAIPMGRVLPRKAVHEQTWAKIIAYLPPPS